MAPVKMLGFGFDEWRKGSKPPSQDMVVGWLVTEGKEDPLW